MNRPAPVRIDDLADPQFTPEVRAMLDAMAAIGAGIELTPEAVCAQASAETGLDDFGEDAGFRERLTVLLRALDTEAGLSDAGRCTQYATVLQHVKNRLLVEDVVRRNPEVLEERITRPIVIAGLPRTGTTHLHNLIASDAALRSLPYWESLEPVLAVADQPGPGEPDPRLARTEVGLGFINTAMPYFMRMHEMTVDHVHEEIQLLAIDCSTMLFETMAVIPSWRDYYLEHDQTSSYLYLYKVLQVLQWLRGGARWVLKSPQHLEQFGPLMTAFPDATVVVTHRDPVAITASLCTMIGYTARLSREVVDPVAIGAYWSDRVERMLAACVRDRELLPSDRSLDVRFDEFMADDVAMVERVYDLAGQPFTPATRASMEQFMAEHPRGRHGAVRYDLTDFELDAEERRTALQFYVERFGL
jgi:sulfotransferase family protein